MSSNKRAKATPMQTTQTAENTTASETPAQTQEPQATNTDGNAATQDQGQAQQGATAGEGQAQPSDAGDAQATEGAAADQGEATQGTGDTTGAAVGNASAEVKEPGSELAALTNDPEQINKILRPLTDLEKLVRQANEDGDTSLQSVVEVCATYRAEMLPNKITDSDTIRSQQLSFFRMVRDVLASPTYCNHGLNLILSYMREDYDGAGAMSVPFMMRGFDDGTLANMPEDNRRLFWALVTLLTTAATLADPQQTFRKVSMTHFQETTKLTNEQKQRLVAFFSA